MPIWGCRMTKVLLASVLGICAATGAQATSLWDAFEARCLDPYEHHALAIHAPLGQHPQDQMHDARLVYGPTEEGFFLTLDAAPSEGERACAMSAAADAVSMEEFDMWRASVTAARRYEEVEDEAFLSVDWIEPRLRLEARFEPGLTQFTIIETYLEG